MDILKKKVALQMYQKYFQSQLYDFMWHKLVISITSAF